MDFKNYFIYIYIYISKLLNGGIKSDFDLFIYFDNKLVPVIVISVNLNILTLLSTF